MFQNRPSIEKDLQQEHFETQLFMHAQPRKENRHPQQVTITKSVHQHPKSYAIAEHNPTARWTGYA